MTDSPQAKLRDGSVFDDQPSKRPTFAHNAVRPGGGQGIAASTHSGSIHGASPFVAGTRVRSMTGEIECPFDCLAYQPNS